jgi:MFS family permease
MLFLIDRVGRRWILLVGAVLSGIIHFVTAAIMAVYGRPVDRIGGKCSYCPYCTRRGDANGALDNENLKWAIEGAPSLAVIALAYIFVGIYGLAWAPGAWIYASEIFPLKYRAKGVGLAAAGNWM